MTAQQRERAARRSILSRIEIIQRHVTDDKRCGLIVCYACELPRMLAAYASAIRRTERETGRT
jgi:hypothetical protein